MDKMEMVKKPIPDATHSIIAMRNAGILSTRAAFFSALMDQEGNGKELMAETDKDIRRILGPNVSSAFKPTYAFEELIRYHEAWREDGIASMAVEVLAQAILGDHFRTLIDVNDEFDSDEERKATLDALKNNPKLKSFKREIDIINKDTKATTNFKALFIQAGVFGSDAAIIERDPDTDLPNAIKILPAMSLGRRFVDKRSWQLIGLEYLDYKFPQSILKAEDVFYIALRNYHMSPGTYHYGYSLFEKIVSLSETNRVINQRNLPETNFRLWSPMLLIKMPNNVNQSVMTAMQDDIANGAGNAIVTNQQVNIDPVAINVSLQEMTNERSSNNLEIIRQLQMPELLYNPDVMNRATSQELMEAWNVFVLQPYQNWIGDIIQEQWIDPILKTLIENDQKGIAVDGQPLQQQEGFIPPEEQANANTKDTKIQPQIPPPPSPKVNVTDTFANDQTSKTPARKVTVDHTQPVTPPGQQPPQQPEPVKQPQAFGLFDGAIDPVTGEIKVSRLKWKIKVAFDPVSLDVFLDKVKAYMILYNNGSGPVGGERVLKGVGLDEDIPEFQQRQLDKQAFQEAQFGLRQKIVDVRAGQMDTNPTPGTPNGNVGNGQTQKGTGPGTGFSGDITKTLKDDLKISPKAASLQDVDVMNQELADQLEYVPSVVKRKLQQDREEDKARKTMMELLLPRIMKKLDEI
jgi:hypothetical protein